MILSNRKVLFLLNFIALIVPLCGMYFADLTGKYNQFGWWLVSFLIVFALADQLLGQESTHQTDDQLKREERSVYYSLLLFLCFPAIIVLSFCGAYFFSNTSKLNLIGRIGWIISFGLTISMLTLAAGHELIHRRNAIKRLIGGFYMAFVGCALYKIEHIRGHHANVATPVDIGSANLNQSVYHFMAQAFRKSIVNVWRDEKKRLVRKGNSVLSWHNELIRWHFVSFGLVIVYYLLFGLFGVIFYIGTCLIAHIVYYIFNYIQHYGLKRHELEDGKYERFSAAHSWSCNFLLSSMASFNFPHHTDHHLNPGRPYPLLRHLAESPQMPIGYVGMFLMALIPPLWFKVMNPRVLLYNEKAKSQKQRADNYKGKNHFASQQFLINEKN